MFMTCMSSLVSLWMEMGSKRRREKQETKAIQYQTVLNDDVPFWERLYQQRSSIQAVTHIDFSARIQTVHKETNERYWQLISDFKKITGIGLIVNTSFNVRGEPVVCTPADAYRCFMSTDMDYLVINDFVYCKTDQPDWENKAKWKVNYQPD